MKWDTLNSSIRKRKKETKKPTNQDRKKERIYEDRTYKDLTELRKGIAIEFPDEIYFSSELGLYKGIDESGGTLELFLYSITQETDSKKVIIRGIYDF
nr:hypothetical protein [uncultured Chryseobacterium sp.]